MRNIAHEEFLLLVRTLANQPSPCGAGRNRCQHWASCSSKEMACDRFEYFVNSGTINHSMANIPSAGKFNTIFNENDNEPVQRRLAV